jgi:G:T-mismatch repair DNA endonuclease (very short patch repair protein)
MRRNEAPSLTLCFRPKRIIWTPEVNERLKRLIFIHGHDWAAIATAMEQTPRQVRQHWQLWDKPESALKEWTNEEDQAIIQLVIRHGCKWAQIAALVST